MIETVLDIQNLSVQFGDNVAVDQVSFHVNAGETVALVATCVPHFIPTATNFTYSSPQHCDLLRLEDSAFN